MHWAALLEPSVFVIVLGLAASLLAAQTEAGRGQALQVDADFPGGNIVLERIDGDQIYIHQDLRDTRGNWFWWHFRVRGAQGRKLFFHFTKSNVIGVRGPAVSLDEGATWNWMGRKTVRGSTFSYAFPDDAADVRFCFAMPYFEANLRRFLASYAKSPHLRTEKHCTTRRGRETKRVLLGKLDGEPEVRVLVTCRHHACECMASYSVEGLIEAVLADTDDGRWLRDRVQFLIVPFMDKDGVEDGDQGKNRKPHDHNRDYGEKSIYPSVKAVREHVPAWSRGRLRLTFDLHCPHIRGTHNEVIYMVGSPSEAIWEQQQALGRILEAVREGPLPYYARNNLPFGKAWNTNRNYGKYKSSSRWCGEQEGVQLATTFEIPYANASRQPVTAESARAFGRDLAKAIRRYLDKESAAE